MLSAILITACKRRTKVKLLMGQVLNTIFYVDYFTSDAMKTYIRDFGNTSFLSKAI